MEDMLMQGNEMSAKTDVRTTFLQLFDLQQTFTDEIS